MLPVLDCCPPLLQILLEPLLVLSFQLHNSGSGFVLVCIAMELTERLFSALCSFEIAAW